MGKRLLSLLLSAILLMGFVGGTAAARETETGGMETGVDAAETAAGAEAPAPESLYAACAVLLDGDSGRVLYEKNGYEARPMASTTKIMTCILALERLEPDVEVSVSSYAASQPQVHLGMREGETYRLEDLLYSLMLESHNDSAVAVAEAVSGSVGAFAEQMNRKAEEIGCENTFFVTPNGLDGTGENGRVHSASAADMARILRYCVMESPRKEEFRKITGTKTYGFTANGRSFSCSNHNAFLSMMEGAFSGKTGFTGEAGYCYVGALERDGKTLIVALLACGWPGNKTYKWKDTRTLMEYGLSAYEYREIHEEVKLPSLPVENGIPESADLTDTASVPLFEEASPEGKWRLLMREDEQIEIQTVLPAKLQAPVREGQTVGRIYYKLDGEEVTSSDIKAGKGSGLLTFHWCISKITEKFFINF